MSENIKHECGIAYVRLLKPLEFYKEKYQTSFYALNKMYLLMEKQHNRGQDGAGIASVKLDLPSGTRYINRRRSNTNNPIKDLFSNVFHSIEETQKENVGKENDMDWMKHNVPFMGQMFLGHLRYGTFGKNDIKNLHPFIRANNWLTRNLIVAGNFNLTNVNELFEGLIESGQHPIETSDTVTILENIGYFLDQENEELYRNFKAQGYTKKDISPMISDHLDLKKILVQSAKKWDGGYVIAGMLGHGASFIMRDPSGIRPAFYYADDEVVVAASERPVIQTSFNLKIEQIKEIEPGHALIVNKDGSWSMERFCDPKPHTPCSFERIYFSRGTDKDIYIERKKLGKSLVPSVLKVIDYDIENTVFSYIPNTAAVAFRGLHQELFNYCDGVKKQQILEEKDHLSEERLSEIMSLVPRVEKIAVKDVKLRTFIAQDNDRNDLVEHVYDVTYGVIREGVDNLVIVDDSIVRGTTLKKSILRIIDRLGPKKIIIVSSAPQIRYPDCYGIDMAKVGDFIAFQSAIGLLKDRGMQDVIDNVYKKSKAQENLAKEDIVNYVKEIYKPFTVEEINKKAVELLKPEGLNADVELIYQTIEGLHKACPNNKGDWYFTGDYPTPGGNKVVNQSFIYYVEGNSKRAY